MQVSENDADAWMGYQSNPEDLAALDASDRLLRWWAEWVRSTPLVRGLGRCSEEHKDCIIDDKTAMRIDGAICSLSKDTHAIIKAAYLRSDYPRRPEILDAAIMEFYRAYND